MYSGIYAIYGKLNQKGKSSSNLIHSHVYKTHLEFLAKDIYVFNVC